MKVAAADRLNIPLTKDEKAKLVKAAGKEPLASWARSVLLKIAAASK